MADNIIRGIITIDATGATQGAAQASAAINKAGESLKKLNPAANQATFALTNLGRVVQDAPYGFIGIANNINPLLESFQRLKAETGSTKLAMSALGSSLLGAGGLGFAVSIATSAMLVFSQGFQSFSRKAKEAKDSTDELKDSITGIFKEAGKEAAEAESLIVVLKSETETRERKLAAIKELQKIQPEVFANLKLEGNAVAGLDEAYKSYLANLRSVVQAKILQAKLEAKIAELLQAQGATATGASKKVLEGLDKLRAQGGNNALTESLKIGKKDKDSLISNTQKEIEDIIKQLGEVSKAIKIPEINVKPKKVKIGKPETFDITSIIDFNGEDAARAMYKKIAEAFKNPTLFRGITGLNDKGLITNDVKVKFKVNSDVQDAVDRINSIKKMAQDLGKEFQKALGSSIEDGFASVFEGIGNVLTGKDFGSGLVKVIGDLLTTLGKALVKYGLIKEGLDKIIGPGGIAIPGAVAIALGASAIAFGQVFKNLSGRRALGGPVGSGGSYLVGERGAEIFTPNVNGSIIPNNKMGSYGGGAIRVYGETVVRGQDLVFVLANANRSQTRLV